MDGKKITIMEQAEHYMNSILKTLKIRLDKRYKSSLIILSLVFISCSTNELQMNSTYKSRHEGDFIFYDDGVCRVDWHEEMYKVSAWGFYNIKQNYVLINFGVETEYERTLITSTKNFNGETKLYILGNNGFVDEPCIMYKNGNTLFMKDNTLLKDIDSVRIFALPFFKDYTLVMNDSLVGKDITIKLGCNESIGSHDTITKIKLKDLSMKTMTTISNDSSVVK